MEVKTVSTGQLTLPAPVRFWSQFLNGGLTTASTENQRFGFRFVFFLQTSAPALPTASSGMRGPDAAGNPEELVKAAAAKASGPPSPEALRHGTATSTVSWLCPELSPSAGAGKGEGLGSRLQ